MKTICIFVIFLWKHCPINRSKIFLRIRKIKSTWQECNLFHKHSVTQGTREVHILSHGAGVRMNGDDVRLEAALLRKSLLANGALELGCFAALVVQVAPHAAPVSVPLKTTWTTELIVFDRKLVWKSNDVKIFLKGTRSVLRTSTFTQFLWSTPTLEILTAIQNWYLYNYLAKKYICNLLVFLKLYPE